MKNKFDSLDIGSFVADMHGKSFKCNINWQIEEPVRVVRSIELRGQAWGQFIESMCGFKFFTAHNKHCYVIGECNEGLVVAYNYDARFGGIAVIEKLQESQGSTAPTPQPISKETTNEQ